MGPPGGAGASHGQRAKGRLAARLPFKCPGQRRWKNEHAPEAHLWECVCVHVCAHTRVFSSQLGIQSHGSCVLFLEEPTVCPTQRPPTSIGITKKMHPHTPATEFEFKIKHSGHRRAARSLRATPGLPPPPSLGPARPPLLGATGDPSSVGRKTT